MQTRQERRSSGTRSSNKAARHWRFILGLFVVLMASNLWLFQSWYVEEAKKDSDLFGSVGGVKANIKDDTPSEVPFPKSSTPEADQIEKLPSHETPGQQSEPSSRSPSAHGKPKRTKLAETRLLLIEGHHSLSETLNDSEDSKTVVQTVILEVLKKSVALPLSVDSLRFESQQSMSSRHLADQIYFTYQQYANSIPVQFAGARGIAKNLPGGQTLTYLDYGVADIPERAIGYQVTRDQALKLALTALGGTGDAALHKEELLYRAIHGSWQPVYDFEFEGQIMAASVNVETKRVFLENRAHSAKTITGSVKGLGVQFDPSGGPSEALPLPYLTLTGSSGAKAVTDINGQFKISVNTDRSVSAALSGRFARVNTFSGANLKATGVIGTGATVNLTVGSAFTSENRAQVNGYYHTNVVRDFLRMNGVNHPSLDRPVTVGVNSGEGTCNAYYSSGAMRFFKEDTRCANSAFDTVIYHEYGHLADDVFGGITNSGLSEGWGDILAVLITGQPLIGQGFFKTPQSKIRSADNTYVYSPADDCANCSPHKLGQSIAGFTWVLRQELIKKYGQQKGVELTEDLILPSLVSNSRNILTVVREAMVRDDDDGNLSNGAPRLEQLRTAARKHGLESALGAKATQSGLAQNLLQ
jgi:hypothetical protein